jgi:hypothetical protein
MSKQQITKKLGEMRNELQQEANMLEDVSQFERAANLKYVANLLAQSIAALT